MHQHNHATLADRRMFAPWHVRVLRLGVRGGAAVASVTLLTLLMLTGGHAVAADGGQVEQVGVSGSDVKYPVAIESTIGGTPTGDKRVQLVLTGTAQRQKAFTKVYVVGSYVEQGVGIKDATELAARECTKQLHLVMERGVDGDTMAQSFVKGIHLNYPDSRFAAEEKELQEFMNGKDLKEGDQLRLTHIAGVGFRFSLPGNQEVTIRSVPFAKAIWEVYFGRNDIGEGIKQSMTSRLPIAAAG